MKRKLRTIIAAALAAAMCAAFAGCGKDETTLAGNSGTSSKTASKVKVDPNKEQISPFDDLQVTFTGVVPNSKVSISGGNPNITYTPNKTTGVKNGDEIEVTAKLIYSSMEETYQLVQTSETYTVEGLTAYAMKLDEIPKETMDKMIKQAEDSITAYAAGWNKGNTMTSLDNKGCYMLAAKEGFSPNPTNMLYCVFKVTADIEKGCTEEEYKADYKNAENDAGEDSFYTYVAFSNILLLADGTCSVDLSGASLCSNNIESKYGYSNWGFYKYRFQGYKDLDSMFNAVVAKQVANYDYENTVKG